MMAKVELTTRRRNFIVAVMLISAFVAILNQTLLNTALPSIMRELNINESTSQWLVTGFMLVNGVMIPLTAYLMDRIKTRPLYLAAMGTFFIRFYCCSLSSEFWSFNVSTCNSSDGCRGTYALNAIYVIYIVQ